MTTTKLRPEYIGTLHIYGISESVASQIADIRDSASTILQLQDSLRTAEAEKIRAEAKIEKYKETLGDLTKLFNEHRIIRIGDVNTLNEFGYP
jgi:hypothetical protein